MDAQIYAKVYRTDTQSPLTPRNGYPMVAFFLAKDGFSLSASSSQPLAFTWNLPNALPRGDYEMVLYVTSAHRYNLLGLPFNDGVKGAVVPFTVTASPEKEEPPAFNKDGVTLNGESYYFKEPEPAFPEGKPVTITAPLKNPGSVERAVKVTYKVYNYEGGSEENVIDQKEEVVTLKPGQTLPLSYTVQPHNHIVSYVLIDAAFEDVHSLMNMRFFYTGGTQSEARIKFPGVAEYPFIAGHEAVAFSCLNALNGAGMYGTLTMTVTNPGGEELAKKTFSGLIMSQVAAFGLKFVPKEDVTDFDVTTELAQKNGTVLERVTQQYRCADIDPSACKKRALSEGTSTHGISFLILGALLLICIGVVALLYLKSKKTLPPIAPLVFCFILTLGMFTVHAPSAQAIAPPGDDNGMYECTDGDDNDADGLTDYDDPDCHGAYDDYEGGSSGVSACVDGVDNDGDGRVDYDPTGGGDPDCTSFIDLDESGVATYPACVDGVDNDGDGLVDGKDPGCAGNADNDETDPQVTSASSTGITSGYLNKKTTPIQMTEPDRMLPAGAGVAWVSPSGNVWAAASMNDGSILSSGSRVYLEFPRSDNDLAVTAYGEAESDPPACWADFVSSTYQNGFLTGFQGCAMQSQKPVIICNTQPCNRIHIGPFTFGAIFVQPSVTVTTSNASALSCDSSFTCTAGSVLATTSVNITVHFNPITVYPGTDETYEINVPMSGQPNDITFPYTVVPGAVNTASFLGQNVKSGTPIGTPASSVTVPQGDSVNLLWSTNATQCTRSMSPSNTFWSGTSAVASGNEIKSVGLAVGNYQLYLDCGTAPRKTVTLYVTTPSATKNLTAENLVVPATLQTGQPLTISGSVHNTGVSTLSGFTDNFTYCVVGTGCNSNSWQTMSGHVSEASLVAGASRADSYTTWNPTAGQYRVQYCVDSQDTISDESNEGDNCAQSGTLTVTDGAVLTCGGAIPANGVSWGTGEEPPTVSGINWTFSATNDATKCQYKCNTGYTYDSGTQTCIATSSPTIVLSASPSSAAANPTMASTTLSWTASNFSSNSCSLLQSNSATEPFSGIVVANGLSSSGSFVQSQSQGTKYYAVLCDGTKYSNAVSFVVTAPTPPDLSSNIAPSVNGSLKEGQSVTFSGQVKNVGSLAVTAPFSDEFSYRWGASGAWTPIDPPTGGDILKSYSAGAPFGVGATAGDTSSSLTLTQSGSLQIQHCIDSLMQIAESNEGNNCRVSGFFVAKTTQCSDGVDNDGDGKVDFPADGGCTLPMDDTEGGQCLGMDPVNATLCPGDDDPSGDQGKRSVNVCTVATKCEYQCNSGYTAVLNRCISGTISGTPTEVAPGGTSDITWSVGGNTTGLSCEVSGGSDSWSGTSGTQTSSPITAQTLYILSCNGIAIDSVTINLIGAPVLTANPRIVSGGGTSALTYDLKANTNCTLTGGGLNQALLSPTGTITSNAIFGTTKYTITCDGGISTSATVELREEGHET